MTTGAEEAAAALRDACQGAVAPLRAAFAHLHEVRTGMLTTTDVVAMMRQTAALILALEAVHKASKPDGLRAALAAQMEETGCTSIDMQHHSVSLVDGRRTVVVTDPTLVPAHLLTEPQPDKIAIAKAIKNGPVAGCELSNGGVSSIRITQKKKAA